MDEDELKQQQEREAQEKAAKEAEEKKAKEAGNQGGDPNADNRLAELEAENKRLSEAVNAASQAQAEAQSRFEALERERKDREKKEQDAARAAERKAAEDKGEWDRVRTMMGEEHEAALKAAQETTAAVTAERDKLAAQIEELTVGNEFGGSAFIKNELTLSGAKTRQLYGAHFDVVDGVVVPFDKPRGAEGRTQLVDASGKALSFDKALEKIVGGDPDKDSILKSKLKPGAGSTTTDTVIADDAAPLSGRDKISNALKALGE